MDITVTLPDDADPKTVDALEKAIETAGGTWTPSGGAEESAEPTQEPGEMMAPGSQMPLPPPPAGPLAAGPGAGMLPVDAMQKHGAFALRPRPAPPGR
jgi:hypothetical protein